MYVFFLPLHETNPAERTDILTLDDVEQLGSVTFLKAIIIAAHISKRNMAVLRHRRNHSHNIRFKYYQIDTNNETPINEKYQVIQIRNVFKKKTSELSLDKKYRTINRYQEAFTNQGMNISAVTRIRLQETNQTITVVTLLVIIKV